MRKISVIVVLVFVVVAVFFTAVAAFAAPSERINLTIRPPSYAAWEAQDDSWWNIEPHKEHSLLPRVATLRTDYRYLDGLPVRRDYALAFETGAFRGLYRAMTYRFYLGGIAWRPTFESANGLPHEGAIFLGIRADL